MTTLNISLPESMRQFVDQQIKEGEFTASEYIRHLIRMDQERKHQERRIQIAQYLALGEQQIAEKNISTLTMREMREKFKHKYKKNLGKKSKK